MGNHQIKEWLDHWYKLLGDQSIPPFSDPYDMAGVLADFRRRPEVLEMAFSPLPCSEELLARVMRCIEAETDCSGIYLVPEPIKASDDELIRLAKDTLERGHRCCDMDVPDYPINVFRRSIEPSESVKAAPLVEELGDLYIGFANDARGQESLAMKFLGETLYTLAGCFEVRGYCLTPLCPGEVREIDPYEPHLELWLRGAHAVVRWKDCSDDYWVDIFVRS